MSRACIAESRLLRFACSCWKRPRAFSGESDRSLPSTRASGWTFPESRCARPRESRGCLKAQWKLIATKPWRPIGSSGRTLAGHARKRLDVSGIEVRTSTRVTRVLESAVEINSNETIAADTVIWTAGVRAAALIESLPGPDDRIRRAVVNAHLQLERHPEIFVVGDSAAAVTAPDTPRV